MSPRVRFRRGLLKCLCFINCHSAISKNATDWCFGKLYSFWNYILRKLKVPIVFPLFVTFRKLPLPWGDEDLSDILSILDAHQAKATFFVSGDWVDRYPDAIQAIHAAGHELANHGTNHKHMPQLSEDAMITEIMDCHRRVYALTGVNMTAFRAPYSDWNDSVVAAAKQCGYSSINQNVDSVDWKDYGVESIIQTVMQDPDLGNGAIILLHNGATYTRDALDELLTQLENNGYYFETISDLVYTTDYTIDHTGRQFPST